MADAEEVLLTCADEADGGERQPGRQGGDGSPRRHAADVRQGQDGPQDEEHDEEDGDEVHAIQSRRPALNQPVRA